MTNCRIAGSFCLAGCLLWAAPVAEASDSTRHADRRPADSAQAVSQGQAAPTSNGKTDHPNFFRQLGGDFRHFPSIDTARWLFGGTVGSLIALSFDETLNKRFQGSGTGFYNSGKIIGSAAFQGGSGLLAYGIGRVGRMPKVSHVGLDIVRAQIVSQVFTQALKVTVRRERPDGTKFSFPSGHASATFASAAVLQRHLGWRAGIPAYTVASYVAFSRLHEDKHFLSDVIFGSALGMAVGRTVTRHGRSVYTWTPVVSPEVTGIFVSRSFPGSSSSR